MLDFFEICLLDFIFFIFFLDFFFRFFSLSYFRFFPGRFDTSGFMIRLLVPEIHCTRKNVTDRGQRTEELGILGSGYTLFSIFS